MDTQQQIVSREPQPTPEHPTHRSADSLVAGLCYVERSSEPLYNFMYEPPDGQPQHNCSYVVHQTPIADARSLSPAPRLHQEGFELRNARSQVANFWDDEEVKSVYYQECIELACLVAGGRRAYVFDHQARKREPGRPPLTFGRYGDGSRPNAAGRIHNDYTEASGPTRLGRLLEPAEARLAGRYCIVNIWRSIAGPVEDTPLAVCEARSISASDLLLSEVRYRTRSGEIYLLAHSPRHKWYYYSRMDRHEALVFKQYDSQINGVARYVPHAAFDLPDIRPDAPLRESIEVRCLVLLD